MTVNANASSDSCRQAQTGPIWVMALAVACTLVASVVSAAGGGPGGPGGQRGAPKEALQACQSKAEGDACSMTTPRDSSPVKGSCITTPDKKLACLPEGAPRPKG